MANCIRSIPLFPSNTFLLPGGVARLTVVEAKFLKMLKLATTENGFAMMKPVENLRKAQTLLASQVEIVNFSMASHGLLTIDVKCKSIVQLSAFLFDENRGDFAVPQSKSHWSKQFDSVPVTTLSQLLNHYVEKNPLVKDLYPSQLPNKATWVIARWLELLPLPFQVKQLFFHPDSFFQACQLVRTLIY